MLEVLHHVAQHGDIECGGLVGHVSPIEEPALDQPLNLVLLDHFDA